MKPLTARQREVYNFIRERIEEGKPPSVRDIRDHFGFSGVNGVSCHLKALKRKGWITWTPGMARTIRPVRGLPFLNIRLT